MSTPALKRKHYFFIWAALLVLLLLTCGLAQINLGSFNVVVALAIAVSKMLLVILFFMHARFSSKLTWIFVAAGFIWLILMVDLTLSDYLTRGVVTKTGQAGQRGESQEPALQPGARSIPAEAAGHPPGRP